MILRKPYAFFIKHFKLIHIVLAILLGYSVYKTKLLLDFFNEYSINIIDIQGQDLITPLLPFLYQIIALLIIGVSLIVLVVMIVKKKPSLFYIITIVSAIFTFVIIQVAKNTLNGLSETILDSRTIMLVRDLITVCFLVQLPIIVITIIRATGFDVRKFDFQTDLKKLEIADEDREEVEVEIKFDTNKSIRGLRRKIRFLKYAYKENKLAFNISFSLIGISLFSFIIFSFISKEKIIEQNTYFYGNNFSINLIDSYLVNTDYKGNLIDIDYYYLILKINIKNNTSNPLTLDIATTKILIDNYVYTPITKYRDSFFDFGNIYQNEEITNEYQNILLVYEIPKELIKKEIIFSFVDKNTIDKNGTFKATKVNVNYQDLTGISSSNITKLNNDLIFKDSILDDFKINISAFDISDKYKLKYNFCIKTECFESYEYITPEISGNYDKSLLRIKGTLTKENSISGIYDLYDFIEKFGTLVYTVDGQKKKHTLNIKEVTSKKLNKDDIFYLEVLDEVKQATNISFIFTIRNKNYEYILK